MQSLSEITSLLGFIFRLLKFFFIFFTIFTSLLLQTHYFGFAVTNLFTNEYHFVLKNNNQFFGGWYNTFIYFFSRAASKAPFWLNIATIFIVPSLAYSSYYNCKTKILPGVITGTIINNTIYFFGLATLKTITQKYMGLYSNIFYFIPVIYCIYLFRHKLKPKKNNIKFESINKKPLQTQNDTFSFDTINGKIFLENPYRGIYIQGGAGSGKSASIFEPIIQQLGIKEFTGILYDFKSPELTNLIYLSYQNTTIKVKNVDFKRPLLSDRVNPIDPNYLGKSAIAMEYAQVILNNLLPESIKKPDFWISNAKMILAGVIWYLRKEHPKYCTLPHAISLILHSQIDVLIEKVSQDYEAGGMVASLRESIERGAERTVAGMLSTLQNALSGLNSHDIFWLLSSNDVDLHLNNKENPTFLCLGNDSTLPTTYTPAISLIISVALRQMNQPDQQKSVVLLDEAPTIFIPNIEQIPATARSNKIATIFGVQDFAQLADKYGQEKAQVIISNLGNQFFGRITNGKTAEMIQNLFSKKDEIFVTKNDGSGTSGQFIHLGSNTNAGTSEAVQERDRVKISDLVNLSQGEFYGIIAEGSPREFLKTQFVRQQITGEYINTKIPVNAQIMADNYMRIIEECKTIIE